MVGTLFSFCQLANNKEFYVPFFIKQLAFSISLQEAKQYSKVPVHFSVCSRDSRVEERDLKQWLLPYEYLGGILFATKGFSLI